MGLDSVELVIEVEQAFDTPIPDEAAGRMRTPGDIFDYLAGAGFEAMPVGPCLSQAVFNRLRRAIVAEFDVDRLKVKPRTTITRTIPQFVVSARRKSLLKRLKFRRPSPLLADGNWFRRDYGTLATGELRRASTLRDSPRLYCRDPISQAMPEKMERW